MIHIIKNFFYNMVNLGENVHIFKDEIERVEIPELNTVVYGASFKEKYIRESKLKDFTPKEEDKDLVKIMVLHGDLGNNETGEYNPLLFKEIEESKMDYIALGHIHKFSGIKKESVRPIMHIQDVQREEDLMKKGIKE